MYFTSYNIKIPSLAFFLVKNEGRDRIAFISATPPSTTGVDSLLAPRPRQFFPGRNTHAEGRKGDVKCHANYARQEGGRKKGRTHTGGGGPMTYGKTRKIEDVDLSF